MKDKCIWVYRPGTTNSHWAQRECDNSGFAYLSRIKDGEHFVGVADWYNDTLCPKCHRPVLVDYKLIRGEKK